jgi:hypothetical protein
MCYITQRKAYYDWLGEPDPRPRVIELIDLYDKRHADIVKAAPNFLATESEHSRSGSHSDSDVSFPSTPPQTAYSEDLKLRQSFRHHIVYYMEKTVPAIGDLHWDEYRGGGYPTWILTEDAFLETKPIFSECFWQQFTMF